MKTTTEMLDSMDALDRIRFMESNGWAVRQITAHPIMPGLFVVFEKVGGETP